ncbi:hypothetical protein PS662_04900 [Pseudomonas fluorescens]|uniref:Uncharacterized protein n=1 Tax=Pseudomonas fluorescens TaxID=294 RepID=A0A5E6WRL5_PSEFL|nr:hypothetical protein [Pseudomonas fluorescens]VVN31396.1 hypothetical protein PS662_04900 [Pseudomonas fluorescens]
MIKEILDSNLPPSHIIAHIQALDMSVEIKRLANQLPRQSAHSVDISHSAEIMKLTNTHVGRLTLYSNSHGNISLKAPDFAPAPEQLYSVPGNSILFAIDAQSFPIQLYQCEGDHLTPGELIVVDASNPLFINGTKDLYDSNPYGTGHPAFIGSLNFPDSIADISVFNRESLQKTAWFPHDDSAARYLVSLELLEATHDPGAGKVAEELIYHYHPAVAWKAFQIIHLDNADTALGYAPLLRKLQNTRLNDLLDQHMSEMA